MDHLCEKIENVQEDSVERGGADDGNECLLLGGHGRVPFESVTYLTAYHDTIGRGEKAIPRTLQALDHFGNTEDASAVLTA